jgi:hypothetical protein
MLMVAVAGAGAFIFLKDGLPARATIQENLANQKALVVVEDKANAAACKKRYGFDDAYKYCLLADVNKDPTVILIGDSHAYHVVAGLTKYYVSIGGNLQYLGTRIPFWGLPDEDNPFQKITQPMLQQALDTASAKTIIFSLHLNFEPGSAYMSAARETFRRFLAAGKHVIFMEDVPVLPFEPRSCIKRAGVASSATTSPCQLARSEWDKQNAAHDAALKQLAKEFPQVEWFPAWKALCDANYCYGMIDGRLMYRDTHHLTYEADLMVGQRYAEWARQGDKAKH